MAAPSPSGMTTSSPSPGTTAGFQLAALSQEPSPSALVQVTEVAGTTVIEDTASGLLVALAADPSSATSSMVRTPAVGFARVFS